MKANRAIFSQLNQPIFLFRPKALKVVPKLFLALPWLRQFTSHAKSVLSLLDILQFFSFMIFSIFHNIMKLKLKTYIFLLGLSVSEKNISDENNLNVTFQRNIRTYIHFIFFKYYTFMRSKQYFMKKLRFFFNQNI